MNEERCINCFTPLEGAAVCPHCGYTQSDYAPEPYCLRPGVVLRRRYILGRAMGHGGFGVTYAGFDTTLNIRVAVKEYFPMGLALRNAAVSNDVHCFPTEDAQKYFDLGLRKCLHEVQSLAQLDDIPGVVRAKDYFQENNTAYIIMAFVKGVTLRNYLLRLPRTPTFGEALDLLGPVGAALEQIHARRFVHRDVSPDNIMITPQGKPMLLDFGAVKTVAEGGSRTRTPIIKRGFSPIELYSPDGKIGPWSDVYAYCATLYFFITRKTLPEPMDRLSGDTAEADLRPFVPADRLPALLAGLAVQPEDRCQDMASLLEALGCRDHGPAPGRTTKAPETVPPTGKAEPGTETTRQTEERITETRKAETHTADPRKKSPRNSLGRAPAAEKKKKAAAVLAAVLALAVLLTLKNVSFKKKEPRVLRDPYDAGGSEYVFRIEQCGKADVVGVEFLDSLEAKPAKGARDVSKGNDRSVWMWTEPAEGGSVLYIAAEGGVIADSGCSYLFGGYAQWTGEINESCSFRNLRYVHFNGVFDTSRVTDMTGLFSGCQSLESVDLSSLDTGGVTNMAGMFQNCTSLTEPDTGHIDTSGATNLRQMFYQCSSLASLDLSGFDTSRATDMTEMFRGCSSLAALDFSGFDTSRVRDMEGMFQGCGALASLDLSGFDTSQVRDMKNMFMGCTGLASLDLSGFDTSRVESMACMFFMCSSLQSLDLTSFSSDSLTSAKDMTRDVLCEVLVDHDKFKEAWFTLPF